MAKAKGGISGRRPLRIPDPPPLNARFITRDQAAGFLGVTLGWLNRIRVKDESFPQPKLISPGSPRWRVADLEAWAMSRQSGWSKVGGLRPNSFGRRKLKLGNIDADEKGVS
jgi:predicted DNA-binding transcriptional regulator AlpA